MYTYIFAIYRSSWVKRITAEMQLCITIEGDNLSSAKALAEKVRERVVRRIRVAEKKAGTFKPFSSNYSTSLIATDEALTVSLVVNALSSMVKSFQNIKSPHYYKTAQTLSLASYNMQRKIDGNINAITRESVKYFSGSVKADILPPNGQDILTAEEADSKRMNRILYGTK